MSKEIEWELVEFKRISGSRRPLIGKVRLASNIMFSKYFEPNHGTFFAEYCKEIDVFRLRPHNNGNIEIKIASKGAPTIYSKGLTDVIKQKLGYGRNESVRLDCKVDKEGCILIGKGELP